MRTLLGVLLVALVPAIVAAQNTTGTLAPNTSVPQAQAPTTPGGATNGTTNPAPTTTTPTAALAPAPRDVAIVLCAEEFSTGATRLLVSSASMSAGGATIAPGSPCAQAISDLFVAGFGIIDVQPFNQQLQYTLVR